MLRHFERKSFLVALLCSISVMTSALADESRHVDVPAGDLIAALKILTQQSGMDLVYRSDQLEGLTTQGVSGTLSALEAVTKLLEGTSLTITTDPSGAILISRDPAGGNPPAPLTELQEGHASADAHLAQNDQAGVPDTPFSAGLPHPSGSIAGEAGTLSGRVLEAASGASLPGAIVRVEGTHYATQTDELGRFRFAGLSAGEYLLSISYLGYESIQTRITVKEGEAVATEFQLGRATQALEEVTVFGTRSARGLALNQQRTAENSTSILSADTLGNFTGTTVSEALRRVEGIALARDPVTGDGTNVVIRGLEPNLNQIELNGLNLPGNFRSVVDRGISDRSADLSFLLTDSVSKITVNKSLLPSHDSAGTGGLIEIETKSPLDRPHRFASFNVEVGQKARDFDDDLLASGTLSGTFGSERSFGLSLSAQYRKRSTRNFQYQTQFVFGPFQPLDESGVPVSDIQYIDPRESFPLDPAANRAFPGFAHNRLLDTDISNLGVTLSGAWQIADHTNLRLDLVRATDSRDTFSRSAQFFVGMSPELMPIAALDGEQRWVYAWDGSVGIAQNYRAMEDVRSVTDSFTLSGKTTRGSFHFDYTVGYGRGSTENPRETILTLSNQTSADFDPAFILPAATDPEVGRIISLYGEGGGRGYPLPLLTQAGFDHYNDSNSYVFPSRGLGGQLLDSAGHNSRYAADFSGRYELDSKRVRYLEAGISYDRSKFADTKSDSYAVFCGLTCTIEGTSAADVGLDFSEPGLAAIGRSGGFNVASRRSFESFAADVRRLPVNEDGVLLVTPITLHPRAFDQYAEEVNLAAYVQARVDIGKLEIIGGVRLNRTDVLSAKLSFPEYIDEDFNPRPDITEPLTKLLNLSAVATDVLPRVVANYRHSDNLVFRGGYFLTVARPGVVDLSQEQFIRFNRSQFADFDPITQESHPLLEVMQGNPGLRPTRTHNIDLSVEYYYPEIGLLKLSGFYKRSDDLIESNDYRGTDALGQVVLPDHPAFGDLPEDLVVRITRPVNSPEPAHLWGLEAGIERQFRFLPGIWSGLGVYANVAYTTSSRTEFFDWVVPPVFDEDFNEIAPGRTERVRIPNQPYGQQSAYTGTAALTYNEYGIDATLAYSLQTRALGGYQPYGLSEFSEQVDTLDLRIAREFRAGKVTLFLEGMDLLKASDDPDLEGSVGGVGRVPRFYTGGSFIGGRQFRLGAKTTF